MTVVSRLRPYLWLVFKWAERHAVPVSCGLVVALFAGWLAVERFRPSNSIFEPRYLVSVRSIPAEGEVFWNDLKIEFREKPVFGGLTDQDLHFIRGKTVRRRVFPGEVLTREMLNPHVSLAERVPNGFRAYPVPVSRRVGAEAGDWVDLMTVPHTGTPQLSAERVRVLERRRGEGGEELILAMTQEQIQKAEQGRQIGTLTVILRNRYDMSERNQPSQIPRRRKSKKIEVISEG